MPTLTASATQRALIEGTAPADLTVSDPVLDLTGQARLTLPPGLRVPRLILDDVPDLEELPPRLRVHTLSARRTALTSLPADLVATQRIDLEECRWLIELPDGLTTGTLILRRCTRLESLPRGLSLCFLDLSGCEALRALPSDLGVRFGSLDVSDCSMLRTLPAQLGPLSQLVLSNCEGVRSLPDGLVVTSTVDVARTGLTGLPSSLSRTPLTWRGVPIDERIAFRPETLDVAEVLQEPNAELRRCMVEAIGNERFFARANPKVLDEDIDKGGRRALYSVDLGDHQEPLVCVHFSCPSTARRYFIRVPPDISTCHEAVSWMAGLDPRDYAPLVET